MLLAVFVVASGWGRGPALVASVLGVVAIDRFYLPPIGVSAATDARSLGELAAFLAVATVVGLLSARARQVEREIGARARLQAALAELGQRALLAGTEDDFLGYAVPRVTRTLEADLGQILELVAGSDRFILRAGVGWPEDWVGRTWEETGRDTLAGRTLRSGHALIVDGLETEPSLPGPSTLRDLGVVSCMSTAITTSSGPYGVLAVHTRRPRTFTIEELYFLQAAANVLGTHLDRRRADEVLRGLNAELEARVEARTRQLEDANRTKDDLILREQVSKEKLELARGREVDVGSRIQQMLLLAEPPVDVPGLRIAAFTVPSSHMDGDFIEFYRHGSESLDVIVADVMGKGIPAALLGAATRSHLLDARCQLLGMLAKHDRIPEPREIVTLAHAELARHLISLESFVTLAYLRVDMDRRSLDLVDCGHTGLLHWSAGTGRATLVHGENLPLGAREGEIFDQLARPFGPDDVLLLFSDGITDVRDREGRRFGSERLVACVEEGAGLDPDALLCRIREATCAFAAGERLEDDLTCVALRIVEPELPVARASADLKSAMKELTRARDLVRETCRQLPEGTTGDVPVDELELAITEAMSNVIRHAYHGRPDQWIHVEVQAFPRHFAISLQHLGDPFDPSKAQPPAMDGTRESGFGLYLITRCVDEVRYFRDERGRNCVKLVKARKPGPEGGT